MSWLIPKPYHNSLVAAAAQQTTAKCRASLLRHNMEYGGETKAGFRVRAMRKNPAFKLYRYAAFVAECSTLSSSVLHSE
jgi:hypothetical protein